MWDDLFPRIDERCLCVPLICISNSALLGVCPNRELEAGLQPRSLVFAPTSPNIRAFLSRTFVVIDNDFECW